MQIRWCLRTTSFLLLALMLTVQAANANHELAHQAVDHTELCQAFVTADNAPAIELSAQAVQFNVTGAKLDTPHAAIELPYFSSPHNARSPPSPLIV